MKQKTSAELEQEIKLLKRQLASVQGAAKQSASVLQAQLRLVEYAAEHTVQELLDRQGAGGLG